MEQAKQEAVKMAQDLQAAQDIISRAQRAADALVEETKKETNQRNHDSTNEARTRKDAAELEAKKCLDSAREKAQKIIKDAQTRIAEKNVEIANWEEEKKRIASTHNVESTIKLDIGGHSFTTTLTTLTRFPDTMLGAMFSGRHALTKNEAGAYFIDRDGTHFREILNFLRNPESWDNSGFQGRQLIELTQEAEYYGLKELMFFEPAEAEVVAYDNENRCELGRMTVMQDAGKLWRARYTGISYPYVLTICESCGYGWSDQFTDGYCYGVPKFTTGRTINPYQPRKTGATCPKCKKTTFGMYQTSIR